MKNGRAGVTGAAESLSEGQRACLRMVQLQMTSKEIARHLGISSHTVDQRIRFAMRTLGSRSRNEAALALAILEGAEVPVINGEEFDTQYGRAPFSDFDTQSGELAPHLMHQAETLVGSRVRSAQGTGGPAVGPSVDYRTLDKNFAYASAYGSDAREIDSRENIDQRTKSSISDHDAIDVLGRLSWSINWKLKTVIIIVIAIMSLVSVTGIINAMIALSAILN